MPRDKSSKGFPRAWALAAALVFAAGCAAPLRVRHLDPHESYREQSTNVLAADDVSEFTRTVLRRHDLLDSYRKRPDETLAALRESVTHATGGSDEIFALAELALFYADKKQQEPYALASAVYAYTFLFPEDASQRPTPLDPRTRFACDLYNRAVVEAFDGLQQKEVVPRSGVFPVPFGTVTVRFDEHSLIWHDYRLADLQSVGTLQVEGIRNRYRHAGIGAPLSARPQPLNGEHRDDDLIGPNLRVPVTLVLTLDTPRQQLASDSLNAMLEVHATTEEESIQIGDQTVPLEAEPTAVLATTLVESRPWDVELAAFLGNVLRFKARPMSLRALQPYRPGKIPVVFVHGTASSVFRWADMVNDLQSDRRIRDRYQFWFFTYDSGNPILYSAYRLRQALAEQVQRLDPEGTDPALRQMVVIGHSQGGLLTKMTVIHSGDQFWRNISAKPFDEANLSPQTRSLLQEAMFVEPLPFVKVVIFIATPHRGSYLAGPQIVRRLVQRLVRLPGDVLSAGTELTGLSSSGDTYLSLERVPTSIDNMAPGNPFIRALADIPIAPGVEAYSIIPVKQADDVENGDDGVVKYRSAHIEGVVSELVVHDSHSTQGNPHTVEEVRRILLVHAAGERKLSAFQRFYDDLCSRSSSAKRCS